MLVAIDVDYRVAHGHESAVAACVSFADWRDPHPISETVRLIPDVAPYVSGRFFERELPCIRAVLEDLDSPELVIIDGYVTLDDAGRAGLGMHVWWSLAERVPVIGVAKTSFGPTHHAIEILRGESRRPLFVTAVGIEPAMAAEHVRSMHGRYRIPTLLGRVDRLCREG